jgi:hypothetical protein
LITLVTNIKRNITTQLNGWNFNSFAKNGGNVLAACPNGLYLLGGNTDNGTIINSFFTIGNTDFNTSNDKKFRFLYFRVRANANLKVTITVDSAVVKEYIVPITSDGEHNIRIPCSRVQKGRAWTIRVDNVNGGYFLLYDIKALPVVIHL